MPAHCPGPRGWGLQGFHPREAQYPLGNQSLPQTYLRAPPPPTSCCIVAGRSWSVRELCRGREAFSRRGRKTLSLSEPPTSLQPGPAACGVRGPKAFLGSWWPWLSFRYLTPPPAFKSWAGFPIPRETSPFPPSLAGPRCGKNDFYVSVGGHACLLSTPCPCWGPWLGSLAVAVSLPHPVAPAHPKPWCRHHRCPLSFRNVRLATARADDPGGPGSPQQGSWARCLQQKSQPLAGQDSVPRLLPSGTKL